MIPPAWLLAPLSWFKSAVTGAIKLAVEWPRTTLAIVACVAAWFAHGWDVDRKLAAQAAAHAAEKKSAEDSFEKAMHRKREEVADLILAQQSINLAWMERERAARADADARLKAALAKVPRYVTPLADSRCIVPVGFLQYAAEGVDAANGRTVADRPIAAEAVPEEAMGLVDQPSGVPLSAVSRWQREFAAVGEAWRKRALMCDAWVDEQAAEFNKPRKVTP